MSERTNPACRVDVHRESDWSLEHLQVWRCGRCDPPSRGLVKAGMVTYRNGGPEPESPSDRAVAGPSPYPEVDHVDRGLSGSAIGRSEVDPDDRELDGSSSAGSGDLTPVEVDRLGELERVVEKGLQTFVEVGTALGEIRDRRLYRASHSTFEAYLRERWSISRSRGYRLIDAAEVAGVVSPIGDIPNEAVARELAPLKDDPERAREAWAETVAEHGPSPTAKQLRDVVRRPPPAVDAPAGRERREAEEAARLPAIEHEAGLRRFVRAWQTDLDETLANLNEAQQRLDAYLAEHEPAGEGEIALAIEWFDLDQPCPLAEWLDADDELRDYWRGGE